MPAYSTEALILRTYRFGEADLIVVFLTRDRGKRRGVARNAVKSRRRFGAALEPLTRGRVAYFEKEQQDLVRLDRIETMASPLSSAMRGTAGTGALGHAGYFAELLDEWAPEAQANEKLFRLGASVGDALAQGAPVAPLARYFEYWLLKLEGVYPDMTESGISAEALAFLREAGETAPAAVGTLRMGRNAGRELEAAHRRLIAMHLDKELRSARVLREIGPDLL
ncbi:MAG TPA: DNA repair protein RecO [Vicinamibacterales bacterium]